MDIFNFFVSIFKENSLRRWPMTRLYKGPEGLVVVSTTSGGPVLVRLFPTKVSVEQFNSLEFQARCESLGETGPRARERMEAVYLLTVQVELLVGGLRDKGDQLEKFLQEHDWREVREDDPNWRQAASE